MSYTESSGQSKSMLRVILGNFPARSKAYLQAFCAQQLDYEDDSYCFRLPMAFVPPYMGDMNMQIKKGICFAGHPVPVTDLSMRHQQRTLLELNELLSQPTTAKSGVVWDINVLIKSQAEITRLVSSNH